MSIESVNVSATPKSIVAAEPMSWEDLLVQELEKEATPKFSAELLEQAKASSAAVEEQHKEAKKIAAEKAKEEARIANEGRLAAVETKLSEIGGKVIEMKIKIDMAIAKKIFVPVEAFNTFKILNGKYEDTLKEKAQILQGCVQTPGGISYAATASANCPSEASKASKSTTTCNTVSKGQKCIGCNKEPSFAASRANGDGLCIGCHAKKHPCTVKNCKAGCTISGNTVQKVCRNHGGTIEQVQAKKCGGPDCDGSCLVLHGQQLDYCKDCLVKVYPCPKCAENGKNSSRKVVIDNKEKVVLDFCEYHSQRCKKCEEVAPLKNIHGISTDFCFKCFNEENLCPNCEVNIVFVNKDGDKLIPSEMCSSCFKSQGSPKTGKKPPAAKLQECSECGNKEPMKIIGGGSTGMCFTCFEETFLCHNKFCDNTVYVQRKGDELVGSKYCNVCTNKSK
jgi:hypothetical protein